MTEPAASGGSPSAEFGLVFRAAREGAGMTQDHVADTLHLDVAVVSAIEDGRFADLPMRPYARGYVRNYARILGLDADELAQRFDAADAGRPEPSVVVPRLRVTPKSELALRPLALGYAAIVAALLIALGAVLWTAWRVQDWQFPFLADDATAVSDAAVQPATESPTGPPDVSPWPSVGDGGADDVAVEERATVAASADGASFSPVPAAVADEPLVPVVDGATVVNGAIGELTVFFEGESWVSVDDATGRQLFGDLGRNGREVTVAGRVPLSVLVGNAPGVRVEFDGESVDLEPFTSDTNVARFELGG